MKSLSFLFVGSSLVGLWLWRISDQAHRGRFQEVAPVAENSRRVGLLAGGCGWAGVAALHLSHWWGRGGRGLYHLKQNIIIAIAVQSGIFRKNCSSIPT